MKRADALRILDANFNRSREGLRVCEEVARFILEDPAISRDLKKIRHSISRVLTSISAPIFEIVAARDSVGDVGKEPSSLERGRSDVSGLFLANIERVKESLRVLEEVSKFIDVTASNKIKKIRFHVYTIEKKTVSRLAALRHHRSHGRKKSSAKRNR